MKHIVGGGSHVNCGIMTYCVRKSICDSPLNVVNYNFFPIKSCIQFTNQQVNINRTQKREKNT